MTLSLCMIAKDELENLKRLYPLVKDHIDEWVVVVPPKDKAIPFLKGKATVIEKDFTQAIEPEIVKQFRDYGLEIDADYRIFNFAAARNASLAAATGDYVLWLDADDEPIGMDNVKLFVEKNSVAEVFDAVYDYFVDEEGNSISDHVRERVVINNGKWEWRGGELGLIHETLLPKRGYEPLRAEFPDDIFRVKHHTDHVDASSMRNHVALLYEYLKTRGKDPRTTYYLGIEFFNRGMYDYSIKIFMEYVKVGGSTEDRYSAYLKMAEAYHLLGNPESGRNAYLTAINEMPHRPEAYLGLGESYHEEENWGKSQEFMMTGLQKKLPKTKHAVSMINFTFRPAGYIALNYLQLGKPREAYEWFIKAAKMNPKHPWVKEHASLFMEGKELDDYVRSFVKLAQQAQKKYPRTLHALSDAIPDELMNQELLLSFRRLHTKPKVWPSNSIVYYCSAAFEDWGPDSLQKGCGGSEEAVIHLTKQWVKLGYDVTVYCNCVREVTVDGVKWVRYERFNPRDIFNIIISWRNNSFLDPVVASKKFIDMHDVPDLEFFPEDSIRDVTIMVKSDYHRSLFPDIPDERFMIVPNGVDLTQFKNPKKVKNSLVWTSSYDRGLEYLLEMWPQIQAEVPDATIDVAYGFQLYDQSPWGRNRKGQQWKARMLKLLDQKGVRHRGRLSSTEVATLYNAADVFAYPSGFPEIDMISLTKAMAAKCVPIATQTGAVKERNQGVVVDGDINDPDTRQRFTQELIALLKDEKRKKEIRSKLDVNKYSWDEVAKQWDGLFHG